MKDLKHRFLSILAKGFHSFKESICLKILYGLIIFIGAIGLFCSLFGIHFYWNDTGSTPYTLFIGSTLYTPKKEIYVASFPSSVILKKALHGKPVIKKMKGLPGDVLQSHASSVFINQKRVGEMETLENHPLSAIQSQVIPTDFYYLGSDKQERGFDSRYQEFGLIHKSKIRCQVWPIY